MMSSERRRLEKTTRVAGRRATFREGLVLGHLSENGCYSVNEWHIALSTKPGKAHYYRDWNEFRLCTMGASIDRQGRQIVH